MPVSELEEIMAARNTPTAGIWTPLLLVRGRVPVHSCLPGPRDIIILIDAVPLVSPQS